MSDIQFVDVTLRDGNHTVKHQFSPDLVARTAKALDDAGVNIIEVGHGDGAGEVLFIQDDLQRRIVTGGPLRLRPSNERR